MSASAIALSGLMFQSDRVTGAAVNLANQQSRGALAARTGPAPYQPTALDGAAQAGGGVRTVSRPLTAPVVATYDPSASYADDRGMVGAPNVDAGRDLLTLSSATLAYKTNLKVIETQDDMTRQALRLTA